MGDDDVHVHGDRVSGAAGGASGCRGAAAPALDPGWERGDRDGRAEMGDYGGVAEAV